MLPTCRQWQRWTLPSKASYLGLVIALVGIVITFILADEDEAHTPETRLVLEELAVVREPLSYSWRFQLANATTGLAIVDRIDLEVIKKWPHPETDRDFPTFGLIESEELPPVYLSPEKTRLQLVGPGNYAFPAEDILALYFDLRASHKPNQGWIYDVQIVVSWHAATESERRTTRSNIYRVAWPGFVDPLSPRETIAVRGGPEVPRPVSVNHQYPERRPEEPKRIRSQSGLNYSILYSREELVFRFRPERFYVIDVLVDSAMGSKEVLRVLTDVINKYNPGIVRIYSSVEACEHLRNSRYDAIVGSGFLLMYEQIRGKHVTNWMQRHGRFASLRGRSASVSNIGELMHVSSISTSAPRTVDSIGELKVSGGSIYGDFAFIEIEYHNSTGRTFERGIIVDVDRLDDQGNSITGFSYLIGRDGIPPGYKENKTVHHYVRNADVGDVRWFTYAP